MECLLRLELKDELKLARSALAFASNPLAMAFVVLILILVVIFTLDLDLDTSIISKQ